MPAVGTRPFDSMVIGKTSGTNESAVADRTDSPRATPAHERAPVASAGLSGLHVDWPTSWTGCRHCSGPAEDGP